MTAAHGEFLPRVADVHTLANSALARPAVSGHRLVYNYHGRRVGIVVHRKGSAFEKRNARSAEVVPINAGKRSEFQLPVIRGNALDGERRPRGNIGCGDRVADGYSDHSRLARQLVDNRSVKRADRRCGGILRQRKLVACNQSVVGTETGVRLAASSVSCAGKRQIG